MSLARKISLSKTSMCLAVQFNFWFMIMTEATVTQKGPGISISH